MTWRCRCGGVDVAVLMWRTLMKTYLGMMDRPRHGLARARPRARLGTWDDVRSPIRIWACPGIASQSHSRFTVCYLVCRLEEVPDV